MCPLFETYSILHFFKNWHLQSDIWNATSSLSHSRKCSESAKVKKVISLFLRLFPSSSVSATSLSAFRIVMSTHDHSKQTRRADTIRDAVQEEARRELDYADLSHVISYVAHLLILFFHCHVCSLHVLQNSHAWSHPAWRTTRSSKTSPSIPTKIMKAVATSPSQPLRSTTAVRAVTVLR